MYIFVLLKLAGWGRIASSCAVSIVKSLPDRFVSHGTEGNAQIFAFHDNHQQVRFEAYILYVGYTFGVMMIRIILLIIWIILLQILAGLYVIIRGKFYSGLYRLYVFGLYRFCTWSWIILIIQGYVWFYFSAKIIWIIGKDPYNPCNHI